MRITIFPSFSEAEPAWRNFENLSNHYGFQSFAWQRCCYESFGKELGIEPCIVLVEDDDGDPLFLMPLGIQVKCGTRVLLFIGDRVTDYNAPLMRRSKPGVITSKRTFAEIWEAVLDSLPPFDLIQLVKMPEFIRTQPNPFSNLGWTPYESGCSIDLTGDWKSYSEQHLDSKFRADTRRRRRRLEEVGEVKFIIADEISLRESLLTQLIEQKERRYRETGVLNLFANEGIRRFYREMTLGDNTRDMIQLSALSCDDQIVATNWAMLMGEDFYHILPTYKGGKWNRYACGRILQEHLVRWCFDNNYRVFDFTIGGEGYKRVWYNRKMTLFRWTMPRTYKGRLYSAWLELKERVKRNAHIYAPLRRCHSWLDEFIRRSKQG